MRTPRRSTRTPNRNGLHWGVFHEATYFEAFSEGNANHSKASKAMHAKHSTTMQSNANHSAASTAKQCKAMQNNAKQSNKAIQSNVRTPKQSKHSSETEHAHSETEHVHSETEQALLRNGTGTWGCHGRLL